MLLFPNSSQMHVYLFLKFISKMPYLFSLKLSQQALPHQQISQFFCHSIILHLSGNENMNATARQKTDLLIVVCLLERKKQESMSA
jgi:hypothetical protein